ncbi:hypothetical protein V8C42DRAFT_364194 [Trichoderma barbatum]
MYFDYRSIAMFGLLCGASVNALPAAAPEQEVSDLVSRQGTTQSPNSNDGQALWVWACNESNWTKCGRVYGPGVPVNQCLSWGNYWKGMGNGAFKTNMQCQFYSQNNCGGTSSTYQTSWVSDYDYWFANTKSFRCTIGFR